MNVLMISLDSTLLKDRETAVEDSQDRHILYGKYVSQLFIVVRAGRANKPRRLSDNVTVYPAAFGSLWFVWDAYQITKRIVRQSKMETGEVSGILMRMELKGVIRQLPGKMFVK